MSPTRYNHLTILNSVKYVVDNSADVEVDVSNIMMLAQNFQEYLQLDMQNASPLPSIEFDDIASQLQFIFVTDALSFCFWGRPNKWAIEYHGKSFDGWWALLGAIQRAIETSIPILDSKWLANMSLADARQVFDGKPEIPLLSDRHRILKGIGEILTSQFNGSFYNYVTRAPKHAIDLMFDIATTFPGFNDVHQYQGRQIYFFKKAQLLVHDIAAILNENNDIQISDLSSLTGKADYKIPAVLRKFEILKYSQQLSNAVDSETPLQAGSAQEIEIRANMIYATHLLAQHISKIHRKITSVELDNILWIMSQNQTYIQTPYHRTQTVDY